MPVGFYHQCYGCRTSDNSPRVFFTQYLDKQSLSYASVYGLLTDLDLTAKQYSWLTSCFYISQLASEGPFIYLMSRLPIAKFVGATVIAWVCASKFFCKTIYRPSTHRSRIYRVGTQSMAWISDNSVERGHGKGASPFPSQSHSDASKGCTRNSSSAFDTCS